jgi:hypothetical protein
MPTHVPDLMNTDQQFAERFRRAQQPGGATTVAAWR